MKHVVLICTLMTGWTLTTLAQNDRFVKAMDSTITTIQTAQNKEDWQRVLNQAERIANVETKEWIPTYWAAYATIRASYLETDPNAKDAYLDKGDVFYQKARALEPDNEELTLLGAALATARLSVDPQNRWQEQIPIFEAAIEKAKQKNPENPRIYVLQGQSLFYTPEQYGGGKKVACPVLKQATEKFTTFKPASSIHPNWGEAVIKKLLMQCE